jgi:predicted P-loop ATPase
MGGPVKLLGPIDLDGVQRDRDQLWAEPIKLIEAQAVAVDEIK